jgi:hypothetical protein
MKRRAILLHKDHPALLRARRKYARWAERERALYRSHRSRVEGIHGEAKTWHGLARAIRRGLANMQIQAYLTAATVNLKRLVAILQLLLAATLTAVGDIRALGPRLGRATIASARRSLPERLRPAAPSRKAVIQQARADEVTFLIQG